MAIILQESLRALFYAPFYAALALGAYAEEGVDVEFQATPIPGTGHRNLIQGDADVVWGGPMRVMAEYDANPASDLVCFCEVVTRDPFFLVGREARPDFQMADLATMTIGTVSEVPTPWMCLQEDLRRAGEDPSRLRRISNRSMADNRSALLAGEIDVAQLCQPDVHDLVANGRGNIWYSAAARGYCSYTTLYTRQRVMQRRADELKRMTRAIYRTQKWFQAAPASAMASAIADYFPNVPASNLAAACASYRELGVWGNNPILPKDGYDRQKAGLLSGGLIQHAVPFEQAVDNRLAHAVVEQDPPTLERRLGT